MEENISVGDTQLLQDLVAMVAATVTVELDNCKTYSGLAQRDTGAGQISVKFVCRR